MLSGSGLPGIERPPSKEGRSIARGIAAGAVASLIGIPAVFVAFVVSAVLRTTLLKKVMHVSVADSDIHGGTTLLAEALVAGAAGLFGAAVAAWIALSVVKQGQRAAFLATSGVGFALIAIGWTRGGTHTIGSLAFNVAIGWLMALAGLYLAEAVVSEPAGRKRAK